jgi:stage II sporulation protein AA (anti-sigma F factor antagonist)
VSYSIEAQAAPGECVITVTGDVDAAAADPLDAALASASGDESGPTLVIVDLAGANFLDSRSIGILGAWQTRIRASGGRLVLAGTRPEVVRLFELIGLSEAFEFFSDLNAARGEGQPRND